MIKRPFSRALPRSRHQRCHDYVIYFIQVTCTVFINEGDHLLEGGLAAQQVWSSVRREHVYDILQYLLSTLSQR
jgi:hypothetical protein